MNTTEGSDLILSQIETAAYKSLPNSSFSRKTKQEISNSVQAGVFLFFCRLEAKYSYDCSYDNGKRRNEFAEWHVAWPTEWDN